MGAVFPGVWLYGAYAYPYNHTITYDNHTDVNATCLCAQYAECGCDENDDADYLAELPSNSTNLELINGTEHLYINGTLDNGTTATGGDSSNDAGRRLVGAGSCTAALLASAVCAFVLL